MARFVAPALQSSYIDIDGKVHTPDSDGVFDLPQSEGARALGAGFTAAPVPSATDQTADTAGAKPADQTADTTGTKAPDQTAETSAKKDKS